MPLEGNTKSQFKKIVSFEELLNLKNDNNGRLEWEVVLNAGGQGLGSLVFKNRFKEGCHPECWLTQIRIKNAYHGSIIEERIFKKADELLAKLGVECVLISIAKKDHQNRAIITGLGFKARLKDHSLVGGSLVLERMIKI